MSNFIDKRDKEYYLARDRFIKEQGLTPVTDVDEIHSVLKAQGDVGNALKSMYGGFRNTLIDYASSASKFLGADDTYKELQREKRKVNALTPSPVGKFIGEVVGDPVNLAPAGIVAKGAKGAKILKSLGLGTALGASTSIAKDYGNEDVSREEMATNALISGAFWGGTNAFFSSGVSEAIIDKVARSKVGNKISNLFGKIKKAPHEVSKEDIDILNAMRNNPAEFGLNPQDVKHLPVALDERGELIVPEMVNELYGDGVIHMGMNKNPNQLPYMPTEQISMKKVYRSPKTKQEALNLLLMGEKPFDLHPYPKHINDIIEPKGQSYLETFGRRLEPPMRFEGNTQISYESMPSEHLVGEDRELYDFLHADVKGDGKLAREFDDEMDKIWFDESGEHKIFKALGISGVKQSPIYQGMWNGVSNPSRQLVIPKSATKEQIELVSAIKGLALKQDGVGYHKAIFSNLEPKAQNGVLVTFDKKIDRELLEQLEKDTKLDLVADPDGKSVRVISFDEKDFSKQRDIIYDKLSKSGYDYGKLEAKSFKSEGDLVADWDNGGKFNEAFYKNKIKELDNGKGIRGLRDSTSGRPNLSAGMDNGGLDNQWGNYTQEANQIRARWLERARGEREKPILSTQPTQKQGARLERLSPDDMLDSKGAFDVGRLKDGQMTAHNGVVIWKKNGKNYHYYDERPENFESLSEYAQIEAYQRHLDSMKGGFANSAITQNIASGATGGAIGATQGDSNEERLRNALLGAGVATGGNALIKKLIRGGTNPVAKPIPKSSYRDIKPMSMQQRAVEDTSKVKFGKGSSNIPKVIDSDGIKIDRVNTKKDNSVQFYSGGGGALAGIEQNEDGSFSINPQQALLGVVGGLGALHYVRKFKTPREASEFIKKIITEETTKEFKDITQNNSMFKNVFNHVRRSSSNTLSAKYMSKRDVPIREINAEADKLSRLHKGLNALDEETRVGIHKALIGEGEPPSGTEGFVKIVRDTIDEYSEKLVSEGILSREAMEEWKGYYLHRSYEKHIKGIFNQFKTGNSFKIDTIMARGKIKTVSKKELDKMFSTGEITSKMMETPLREGGIRVTQKGDKFEIRRDWTSKEREAMGEIQDASYTIPETLLRMKRMVENGKFLKEVSKMKLSNNHFFK